MADENNTRTASGEGWQRGGSMPGQKGAAPYARSESVAKEIKNLARVGLSNQMILDYYSTFDGQKMSESTLKKYYQDELSLGRTGGVVLASGKLMEKIKEGNLTAIIFYLKTKGGFIETRGVQVRDKDNQPTDLDIDFSKASKEELNVLAKYFGGILGEDPRIPRAPLAVKSPRKP